GLAERDVRGDVRVAERELPHSRDEAESALEARRVAGREELLGVGGGAAFAAELFGHGDGEVEHVVGGFDAAFTAAVSGCDCGVERFHEGALRWSARGVTTDTNRSIDRRRARGWSGRLARRRPSGTTGPNRTPRCGLSPSRCPR